jgi:hypothetical protein
VKLYYDMGTLERHLAQYRAFKNTADLPGAEPQARVELLFLAAYHLIDACASLKKVPINKHQLVGRELDANPELLGEATAEVREAFVFLERTSRVRFVYGGRWGASDLEEALSRFETVESRCLAVIP